MPSMLTVTVAPEMSSEQRWYSKSGTPGNDWRAARLGCSGPPKCKPRLTWLPSPMMSCRTFLIRSPMRPAPPPTLAWAGWMVVPAMRTAVERTVEVFILVVCVGGDWNGGLVEW